VDVELLSQCSDLASRVVQAESAKLRADHVHAVEARRLSSLLLDIQAGPRVTREHAERAQPYLEVKAHAESLLRGAVARIKEVRTACVRVSSQLSMCTCAGGGAASQREAGVQHCDEPAGLDQSRDPRAAREDQREGQV
jgi:hypothetical protein